MTSFSWIERSLLRVARNATRSTVTIPAEEGVEPRADHVFEQDEEALAVALVGKRHKAADDRGHLEHGVQQPAVLVDRLDAE